MNIFNMDRFKPDALAHVLYRCYNRPGYTAGIIFDKISRKIDFLHEMRLCIHRGELSGVHMLSEGSLLIRDENDTVIQFQNGSKIKVILVSRTQVGLSSMRGRRLHEVLLDFEPTDDELFELDSSIMPYGCDEDADVEDNNEELDEFLNGFTIKQKLR